MERAMVTLAAALLLGLAPTACAGIRGPARPDTGPTLVRVENNHPLRITVEVVSSGGERRLGEVETADTDTFELPAIVTDREIQILLDPIGSMQAYLSPAFVYSPGDVIEVWIPVNLDLTRVIVR